MSEQNRTGSASRPASGGIQESWWERHLRRRRKKFQKYSLRRRVWLWLVSMGIALIVIANTSVAIEQFMSYSKRIESQAYSYAKTAASHVDGDQIVRYVQTMETDEEYEDIRRLLIDTQKNVSIMEYYYICVPQEDRFLYVWDSDESDTSCGLGDTEAYEEADRIGVERAFRTNPELKPYVTKYKNRSYLLTALYPIFNSRGEPVALVGVDMSVPNIVQLARRPILTVSLSIAVVIALFILLTNAVFDHQVVRPITTLEKGMLVYRRTMDSAAATQALEGIRFYSEIGALVGSFLILMVDVDNNTAEVAALSAERERIGTELKVANNIQADMLPRVFPAFPDRHEFDLYASMDPAKEVGGDFYDFFLVDDDHLALVMADVSGKGVPAALFMVISMTLIRHRTRMGGTPEEILRSVNNRLAEDNKNGMFVTVWLAIVELSTGKGIAANAGHEHPVLRRAGGSYELVEYRHSPAVGIMKGIRFREHEFQLSPGDRLVVYTDGVAEAQNQVPELYGTDRMLEALNAAGNASPEETLKALKRSIVEFENGAEQFDDITMLCLDYFGPEQKERDSEAEDETRA